MDHFRSSFSLQNLLESFGLPMTALHTFEALSTKWLNHEFHHLRLDKVILKPH
jgi:hypothetical protein